MQNILFQVVSAVTASIVFITLLRPKTFRFLRDKGTQEPSLGRQGQFTALIISTWGFVVLTLTDKMTEWFFTGYMLAWAGAQFGSLWLKTRGQQSTSSLETTTVRTETTPNPTPGGLPP